MIRQLFKQSGVYFFGSLISKMVTTVAWILLARVLAPAKYGQFTLYFMILQTITILADFGLNQYYLKYVENFGRNLLFNKIFFVRSVILLISIFFMIFFLTLFPIFDPNVAQVLILSMIPMAYLSVSEGYFLEQKKSLWVSLKLTSIGGIFLLGYLIFRHNLDLLLTVKVLFFALLLTFFWFIPWKSIRLVWVPIGELGSIAKKSSSYALLTLTSFVYNRGDSYIISYFRGNVALGIYGLAYRFLESLSLIPSSLVQNLFPISAKKTGLKKEQLIKIFITMLVLGIFFAVTLYFSASFLILTLFHSSYSQSILILKIFSFVIFLFFINSPLSTVVQSSNLVRAFLPYGILNTLLNILLNILLIPRFGIFAAAWMMVVTELTGLVINIYFVKKLYSQ